MKKTAKSIRVLRFEFASEILDEKNVSKSPFLQFENWLSEVLKKNVPEPNAMTLATADSKGNVDARIVLLRDFSEKGFSFFSNYNSIKGKEIRQNKKVCLNFFWPELHRQVRIRGAVTKLPTRISDYYFSSRPRESQLAAWASKQSDELSGREELLSRFDEYENKFKGKKVPRPPHWGGYLVRPVYFEFWHGQTNRLHNRITYSLKRGNKWELSRLNP